ncbi:oxidoreductase [Massariosphaeria phaeospora]|uniref:Oxidoreductase n=1 Tax=Massariosphaeria phaeospora TaxID=100035 RepID=A0A7C8MZ45_9PLEO|nr:oxidoreductase [Massariosphaeria phaeospora]
MPKSVLITGCSTGGIGYDLAVAFQKRGLVVFATARKTSKMVELEKLPNLHLLALDVTSDSSINEACAQVKTQTDGKLDYLVNNAGRGYVFPLLDADIEEGKKMFDANLWGVLKMIQVFSPLLIDTKGTVVNIGSLSASLYFPWSGLYCASKAALHLFSETLRLELAPLGVNVITVGVGAIQTSFHADLPEVTLPPNSHYQSIEKQIQARGRGEDGMVRGSSVDFAEKVVGDTLRGAEGLVYRGKFASYGRMAAHLPARILDGMLADPGTGLADLKKHKKPN